MQARGFRSMRFLAATLVAWLVVGGAALATVMVEVPLEDMIADADAIVMGRVSKSGVQLFVEPGKAATPFTVTEIAVDRWLKGSGDATVKLREEGGRFSARSMQGAPVQRELTIAGTPQYRLGEQVVVFLRRERGTAWFRTYGMVQGKFSIRHGVPGVPAFVQRDMQAASFAHWNNSGMTVGAASEGASMELETFLEFIDQTLTQLHVPSRPETVRGAR